MDVVVSQFLKLGKVPINPMEEDGVSWKLTKNESFSLKSLTERIIKRAC